MVWLHTQNALKGLWGDFFNFAFSCFNVKNVHDVKL